MSCELDDDTCCDDLVCDILHKCAIPCLDDYDCRSRDYSYSTDMNCTLDGVCDYDHCSCSYICRDSGCQNDKLCYMNDCLSPPSCNDVGFCKLDPKTRCIKEGSEINLVASAYRQDGFLLPGPPYLSEFFDWVSSDGNIVSIDGKGLAFGLSVGSAVVYANLFWCPELICSSNIVVLDDIYQDKTRVVVIDSEDNAPIAGATVAVGDETPVRTDDRGIAIFNTLLSQNNPSDITVSCFDYEYITMRSVESNDIMVELDRISRNDSGESVIGGLVTKFDFAETYCPVGSDCEYYFGIAGSNTKSSIYSVIKDYTYTYIMKTRLEIESPEDIMATSGFVFGDMSSWFKESSYIVGDAKESIIWAFGSQITRNEALSLFENTRNCVKPTILDYLIGFSRISGHIFTEIRPNTNLGEVNMIADISDIDGDMDISELIPDYSNFPQLPSGDIKFNGITLDEMVVYPPELPIGEYDAVAIVPGLLAVDYGFVPIGYGVGLDSIDSFDNPDGIIDDPIKVCLSDNRGRLPEDIIKRAFLAIAFKRCDGIPINEKNRISVIVKFLDSFHGIQWLDEFITPANVVYERYTRTIDFRKVYDGTDIVQLVLTGDDKESKWYIIGNVQSGLVEIPPAPPEGDRSSNAYVLSIKLRNGVTLDDIYDFNETNIGDLFELVESFSCTETDVQ